MQLFMCWGIWVSKEPFGCCAIALPRGGFGTSVRGLETAMALWGQKKQIGCVSDVSGEVIDGFVCNAADSLPKKRGGGLRLFFIVVEYVVVLGSLVSVSTGLVRFASE